ncbi:MAG TPA: M56 family metallopeptidase [Thermoanaerobaculia bacterium]|nr:M56 family metallopeptidase [Thermoanaerobaculia bacterium]
MENLATTFLGALGRASLHGAVAIAAVWLLCRLFPRLSASLRCGLWWLACLKLLVALVWVEPIALAVLPAGAGVTAAPAIAPGVETPGYQEKMIPQGGSGSEARPFRDGLFLGSQGFEPLAENPLWPLALAGLWGAGLLLQLGLTARQLAAARRVVRSAEPVREPWLRALFAELRERLGVGRAKLLASAEVETPQVSGTWRPRVLLPEREIGRLSAQELALTLAHELLHVRRGDLWLGWIPALAQRLFFFHPLVALAVREYALAREAACDAAVLRALDPAPETYGRLLLRLGVKPRVPRWAAAGAAPTFQTLKRRLEMLQQSADKKRVHSGWWGLLALLALVALVPVQIVAQTPPDPPSPPAVAAIPAPPARPAALPVVAQSTRHGAPPAPPVPPVPPTPPVPPARSSFSDDEHWVLVQSEDSVTMSGSSSDVRRAREHYSGKPILWFKRDGKSYVIRDEATVARVQSFFEPQSELGEHQGELGEQQGKLGDEQGKLGDEMGRYGDRMGELASKQAELAESRDGDEDDSLNAEMEELSAKMEALGKKMEALGRQQEELGRKQEELGRQQEKIAHEGERKLRSLLDQAIASGLAKEVSK